MTVPVLDDPFTDPDELFDVYRADGTPTGEVKRRADVHRDGDWHRAFHCWVTCLSPDGAGVLLILQRRGRHKDTWPGRLDVSVGGHYRAGETLRDVVREVEEEIGRAAALESLTALGRRTVESDPGGGLRDRELQDVYLWRSGLPLGAFRPQPVEVEALEAVAIPDLLRLCAGEAPSIPALTLDSSGSLGQREISLADFIPNPDTYLFRLAVVVDLAERDYPYLVI